MLRPRPSPSTRQAVAAGLLCAAWAVGLACTAGSLDATGKHCPCGEGWVCLEATQLCVVPRVQAPFELSVPARVSIPRSRTVQVIVTVRDSDGGVWPGPERGPVTLTLDHVPPHLSVTPATRVLGQGVGSAAFDIAAADNAPFGPVELAIVPSTEAVEERRPQPLLIEVVPLPGALDVSFGDGGSAPVEGDWSFLGRGLAVRPDGAFIVFGSRTTSTPDTFRHSACTWMQFEKDGRPDVAFGTDGGAGGSAPECKATAGALDPDGKLVLSSGTDWDPVVLQESGVLRITARGVLDPSFGSGGLSARMTKHDFFGVAIGGTTIYAVGGQDLKSARVAAWNGAGAFATSFGRAQDGGYGVELPQQEATAVAIDDAGRILVSANVFMAGSALFRLLPSGALDPDFNGGKVLPIAGSAVTRIRVQQDGKILVVAPNNTGNPSLGFPPVPGGVYRISPTGTPDPTFDVPLPDLTVAVSDALLQPDQRILLAGSDESGGFIQRRLADGRLDTSFADGGTLRLVAAPRGIAWQQGDEILVTLAGVDRNKKPTFHVSRYYP